MKRWTFTTVGLVLVLPLLLTAQKPMPKGKDYPTGFVRPANLAALKAASKQRTGHYDLPRATAPSWDCRKLGLVPPIVSQGDCGSCWAFDGCCVVTCASIKAGYGKADGSFRLSEQYILDCGRNGGCSGDDHSSVFAMAREGGIVSEAEYGPYRAREGSCKDVSKMTRYRIAEWGYCDPGSDIADTQKIKDAMVIHGPIGVAIAADGAFMNVGKDEVFSGRARNINHEVVLVGWDDAKGAHGAWILRNSWGPGFGDGGYCWIEYGANGVGTDAAWVSVTPLPPPPPGPTPPPGPAPPPGPVPPVPPGRPVVITLTPDQVSSVIQQSGAMLVTPETTLADLLAYFRKAQLRLVP